MPNESNTPPAEGEQAPDPFKIISDQLAALGERMDGYEQKSQRAAETDSEMSDLADLFGGLSKKLDDIFSAVKPKETVVGTPPAPTAEPAKAPAAPAKRKHGSIWW